MSSRVWRVALLLYGSGLCALIYQTVWLRQFRLIFGASTAASAAVLAIFMGGLGLGGLLLGRRAGRSTSPLALYGKLEVAIALSAALTPLLLWIVRAAYLGMGGSFALGTYFGTVVRLILSSLVLGAPTFLMGATLPAAAHSVESDSDVRRNAVAVLYGANTLGAVTGALLSTFYLLEHFGNRYTLWFAALLNAFIGLTAILAGRSSQRVESSTSSTVRETDDAGAEKEAAATVPPRFVFLASAIVGFAFLLMELVWYRMLTPILGGTTFTFGLILAVALLGIGSGSLAFTLFGSRRPTLAGFTLTCALEALFLAIPFALGDFIPTQALLLRSLGSTGFGGFVVGWVVITLLVVFPAAFVAGVQFPLLISLLGSGREAVGQHIGRTYAWNTAGTIVGSVAGGFGLMPLLSAPGTWRLVVLMLVALAIVALALGIRLRTGFRRSIPAVMFGLVATLLITTTGPTAYWRHNPIGAGRVGYGDLNPNKIHDIRNTRNRAIAWQTDGVESSVALSVEDGYAFLVNGKSDGHSRFDAGTQVMGGIFGGLLHPNPRNAIVIGLGTGTTAGWLAAMPSMKQVDVVEIEADIVKVAAVCTPVNRGVLRAPNVRIHLGDGREFLLTRGSKKYDLISSEPSNPYRAGIASLFTEEFYQAAAGALNKGGLFLQFLQAYEVDTETIRTIYATITAVFPYVETWQTQKGDMLLVASRDPFKRSSSDLRRRLASEPIRSAVWNVWRVDELEGVIARYVAGTATSKAVARATRRNTDDRTLIEYGFARTLGDFSRFRVETLREAARTKTDGLPQMEGTRIDIGRVEDALISMAVTEDGSPELGPYLERERRARGVAQQQYVAGNYPEVVRRWVGQKQPPRTHIELMTFAQAVAEAGDDRAEKYIAELEKRYPAEAMAILGHLRWRQKRHPEAVAALSELFKAARTDPWILPGVLRRAIRVAGAVSDEDSSRQAARLLFDAMKEPFAVLVLEERRRSALLSLAERAAAGVCNPEFMGMVKSYEPWIPWQRAYLISRQRCYQQRGGEWSQRAKRDLAEFDADEPGLRGRGLVE